MRIVFYCIDMANKPNNNGEKNDYVFYHRTNRTTMGLQGRL